MSLFFLILLGIQSVLAEPSAKSPELVQHLNWSFVKLGLVPVQSGGRIKPLDSFAREVVLFETGSRRFEGWEPLDMLFSWVSSPHTWEHKPFIRITRDDVRRQLGLDEKRSLFSPSELMTNSTLIQYAERLSGQAPQGAEAPGAPKASPREQELKAVLERIRLFQSVVLGEGWLLVPQPAPAAWMSILDQGHESEVIRKHFLKVLDAYQNNNLDQFDRFTVLLGAAVEGGIPGYSDYLKKQVSAESLYNRVRPFLIAWVLYLMAALTWLVRQVMESTRWEKRLTRTALGLTLSGAFAHAAGFGLRCFVAGRPPVTNMYESMIWVSLGIVFFALILYKMHRQPVLLIVATTLGVLGLVSGDAAPAILDPSLNPLVPVLRSNYWLTIHVLTITLSYAAFALTLGLANISLFYFLLDSKSQKIAVMNQLTYRAMQFGVVLIAAGTILGGIWADYSWGRFWGWDPKEVWALITLLCYLTILHGRFAGWVGQFGFAAWSAVSFLSVMMAWYGVNFILGVGLHSYGFASGGTPWVIGFVSAELLYVLAVTGIYFQRRSRFKSIQAV